MPVLVHEFQRNVHPQYGKFLVRPANGQSQAARSMRVGLSAGLDPKRKNESDRTEAHATHEKGEGRGRQR